MLLKLDSVQHIYCKQSTEGPQLLWVSSCLHRLYSWSRGPDHIRQCPHSDIQYIPLHSAMFNHTVWAAFCTLKCSPQQSLQQEDWQSVHLLENREGVNEIFPPGLSVIFLTTDTLSLIIDAWTWHLLLLVTFLQLKRSKMFLSRVYDVVLLGSFCLSTTAFCTVKGNVTWLNQFRIHERRKCCVVINKTHSIREIHTSGAAI